MAEVLLHVLIVRDYTITEAVAQMHSFFMWQLNHGVIGFFLPVVSLVSYEGVLIIYAS